MLLRLYNSPRATQDIDYIFISEESKKKLKNELVGALQEIKDISLEKAAIHSRGIFIDIVETNTKTRCILEISVLPSTVLPLEPLSTAPLAQKYHLEARIISALSFEEAFSHKIAAALERRAIRNLYDLSQMEALGTFDQETLKARLSKLTVERKKIQAVSPQEAAIFLQKKIDAVSQKNIEEELHPLLPLEYQAGLLRVVKNSVQKIIQRLEEM